MMKISKNRFIDSIRNQVSQLFETQYFTLICYSKTHHKRGLRISGGLMNFRNL